VALSILWRCAYCGAVHTVALSTQPLWVCCGSLARACTWAWRANQAGPPAAMCGACAADACFTHALCAHARLQSARTSRPCVMRMRHVVSALLTGSTRACVSLCRPSSATAPRSWSAWRMPTSASVAALWSLC